MKPGSSGRTDGGRGGVEEGSGRREMAVEEAPSVAVEAGGGDTGSTGRTGMTDGGSRGPSRSGSRGRGHVRQTTPTPPAPGQTPNVPQTTVAAGGQREPGPQREMVWEEEQKASKKEEVIIPLAKRPTEKATEGRNLNVRVNFYEVRLNFNGPLCVYKVDFQVGRDAKPLLPEQKRAIVWSWIRDYRPDEFQESFANYAYDGASCLISKDKLDLEHHPVGTDKGSRMTVQLPNELGKLQFTMRLRYIGEAEVIDGRMMQRAGELTVLSLVDNIIHQYPCHPFLQDRFVVVGNNFYQKPNESKESNIRLSDGCRYSLYGATANARRGLNGKLYVNMDTSNCVFYQPLSCIDFMCHAFNEANNSPGQFFPAAINEFTQLPPSLIEVLRRYLKGLKVDMKYFKQIDSHKRNTRKVTKIGLPAREARFTPFGSNEPEVTVEEYMFAKHGIPINYPMLPVLVFGTGKREAFVPMELCHITPFQRCTRTLPDADTTKMIKQLCTVAPRRSALIDDVLNSSELGKDKWAQSFELELDNQKAKVTARVLTAPALQHGDNRKLDVKDGVWASRPPMPPMASAGTPVTGVVVIRLLCEDLAISDNEITNSMEVLYRMAKQLGLQFPNVAPKIVRLALKKDKHDHEIFQERVMPSVEEVKANLLIVVMSARSSRDYGALKRLCETKFSRASQCILSKNLKPLKPMTAYNLLLKINVKLQGVNWTLHQQPPNILHPLGPRTMICGIDVCHPGGRDQRVPSMAALVGSLDDKMFKYGASIKINRFGAETTTYIGDAMKERFEAYQAHNKGANPQSVIIFRDGVAQNMFQQTLREELSAIRNAVTAHVGEHKIKITYIVCQKRHHTRLFCDNMREVCGKAQNVPPGTIVDTDVVDSELFDFYLCSHFGIQGTSRPCHYTVLVDDNGYGADFLQALCYRLCHMYARCTRSVSIPAPVYYADKAAERAKYHLLDWLSNLSGKPMSSDDKTTSVQSSRKSSMETLTLVTGEMKETMYFC